MLNAVEFSLGEPFFSRDPSNLSRLGIAVLLRTELYWSLFISSSSNNRTCHRQPQSRSRASQPSLCKLQASKSFASNHQTLLESVNGGFVTSIVRSPQKSPPSSLILRQSSQWQAGRFWAPPPTHRLHHYWLAAFHETCVWTAVEHLRAWSWMSEDQSSS